MPKNKVQKQEIASQLRDKLGRAKSVMFTKFSGLTVVETENLRNQLAAADSEMYVAKKTLLNLVWRESGQEGLDARSLDGQLGLLFGYGDEVAPARVAAAFAKEHEGKLQLSGGLLENRWLQADEAMALAKLPSRQALLAQLVGSLNAPVSGLVNVLAGNLRGFVRVLAAIGESKQ